MYTDVGLVYLLTANSFETSSSVMAPFFTNQSCDPFLPKSSACKLGNYINYAIDVAKRSDISKGIAFATRHNIRLVIRNTGHEYVLSKARRLDTNRLKL